jgi:hypothetical protein
VDNFAVDNLLVDKSLADNLFVDKLVACLQLEDTPPVVHILVEPADTLADSLAAVDNRIADKLVAHILAAHIPAERIQVEHMVADKQADIPGAGSWMGKPVVRSRRDIPVVARHNRRLVDTDIQPADKDNPVAPDMVAAEFLAAGDFLKPERH